MREQLHYVLDAQRQPVPADMETWSTMFSDVEGRRVAGTDLGGGISVSTVFLGLDHSFSDDGPAILFETLVFNGPLEGEMRRYATWDQAEAGHAEMVEAVRRALAAEAQS